MLHKENTINPSPQVFLRIDRLYYHNVTSKVLNYITYICINICIIHSIRVKKINVYKVNTTKEYIY